MILLITRDDDALPLKSDFLTTKLNPEKDLYFH